MYKNHTRIDTSELAKRCELILRSVTENGSDMRLWSQSRDWYLYVCMYVLCMYVCIYVMCASELAKRCELILRSVTENGSDMRLWSQSRDWYLYVCMCVCVYVFM